MTLVVISSVSFLHWGLLEGCESPEFQDLQDTVSVHFLLASHGNWLFKCKAMSQATSSYKTAECSWDMTFLWLLGNVSLLLNRRSWCRDLSVHHQVWQNNLLYPELKVRGPTCIKHSSKSLFQEKHRQCIKSCWVHTLLLLWPAGVLHCSALPGYQKPWNFTKLFYL